MDGRLSTGGPECERAAPGRLELVRQFLNSVDLEKGIETWTSPAATTAWLREREIADPEDTDPAVTDADVTRLRGFREAMRDYVEFGGAFPAASRQLMGMEMERSPLRMVYCEDEASVRLSPVGEGPGAPIAYILCLVREAQLGGLWGRLKVCGDSQCRWVFYDSSKNASAQWCSMAVCGNRAKARRFRDRQVAAAGATGEPSVPA